MALEREARTNIMGSSLDIRNRNWGKLDGAVIVESGSNENGHWVKWGDGTMICTGEKSSTGAVRFSWGPLFYLNMGPVTFPHEFSSIPAFSLSTTSQDTLINGTNTISTTGVGSVLGYRALAIEDIKTHTVNWTAIGKWK